MNAPFATLAPLQSRRSVQIRYLSVCSGIEAASVAWKSLDWTPVGFAEIAPFPSRVLAHHFGSNLPGEPLSRNGVPNFGDFTTIDCDALGPVDLLVGGTPCQAFSIAGRRLSLADARGNLTLSYAVLAHELARSHGLRWVLWENVPGVLSMRDNAFGCFLGALVGHDGAIPAPRGRKWPNAGMVGGPWARAAWIVRDAQYFGLAQRRRRVFVVVGFGDKADPAAVLFERQGLRRHPPTRGQSGEATAARSAYGIDADCLDRSGEGADGSAASRSGLGVQAELAQALRAKRPGAVAFGGNNTSGPIDIATAVNAHGGPCGRMDFESETFVMAPPLTSNPYGDHEAREGLLVTHSLRGSGFDASEDGTGRGTPLIPVAFDCKAGGDTGFAVGDIPGSLRGAGHGGGHAAIALEERNASASETNAYSTLRALRLEVGEETFAEWGLGISNSLRSSEVLRSKVYGESLRCSPYERNVVGGDASPFSENCAAWPVRALWNVGCVGRPPQGWKPSERLAAELGTHLSELSQQGASATSFLFSLWQSSEGLRVLREALSALQEIRRPSADQR